MSRRCCWRDNAAMQPPLAKHGMLVVVVLPGSTACVLEIPALLHFSSVRRHSAGALFHARTALIERRWLRKIQIALAHSDASRRGARGRHPLLDRGDRSNDGAWNATSCRHARDVTA